MPTGLPPHALTPYWGDIVICAPVVEREATTQGKTRDAHWAHLLIHGILHLLGHDHLNDTEAHLMEGLETRILAQLGYPDPYDAVQENTHGG
jgi:probable rRNA maturation factor